MGDTEEFNKFDWRQALRFLQRKLDDYEGRKSEAKILLVDDDQIDVLRFERVLKNFYCELTVCFDPEEALTVLMNRKFDYVFIDQKMPKINGTEVLAQVRGTFDASTRFVVISGFADSKLADETAKLGAILAPKPVSKDLLSFFLRPKPDVDV